jgi:hypothetical protein
MIRRSTWIVLFLLAVLIGFTFYFKNYKAKQAAAVTPTSAASASTELFSADLGAPTDIKIDDATGKSMEVARNEAGTWELKAPAAVPADQAAAEAAASQVTSLQILSTVQIGLDVVGLDKAAYTMWITFNGGKAHILKVGSVTPIEDGYYTSLDGGPVRVVDKQGLDALIPLLEQPPYAATLTPAVPPTEAPPAETATPMPATEPAVSPTPASTGSPAPTAPAGTATP